METDYYNQIGPSTSGAPAKDAQDNLRTASPAIGKARAAPAPKYLPTVGVLGYVAI